MKVHGQHYRTIWVHPERPDIVQIIDQRDLPHRFVIEDLATVEQFCAAIKDMHVRGAGLIGATAGYGMHIAALTASAQGDLLDHLQARGDQLKATRPTAVNLAWAVDRQLDAARAAAESAGGDRTAGERAAILAAVRATADAIADEDAEFCRRLGQHGLAIIEDISKRKGGQVVNILTHCNAGWLAFVDYGSATAPIYAAFEAGIPVHVWVDETRPRNQGARLTAWELDQHGVPHTVIPDNVGGHLMQHGQVDLVITGTDRTTYSGDVANKIGTYLKALAARDNGVPFYVALPSSTFDWQIEDGVAGIPIEQRGDEEVRYARGWLDGSIQEVRLTPEGSATANYAFDVTPRRLVTGLITERGVCQANAESVLALYPEQRR